MTWRWPHDLAGAIDEADAVTGPCRAHAGGDLGDHDLERHAFGVEV
jgi:hypothetical protein